MHLYGVLSVHLYVGIFGAPIRGIVGAPTRGILGAPILRIFGAPILGIFRFTYTGYSLPHPARGDPELTGLAGGPSLCSPQSLTAREIRQVVRSASLCSSQSLDASRPRARRCSATASARVLFLVYQSQ